MKKDTIVIGKITGAHGIKGEISVYPITDDIDRFFDLSYILVGGKKYAVSEVRLHKGQALILSEDIPDRTAAEHMRGLYAEIERKDAVDLNEGEFFIEDLKGLELRDKSGRVQNAVLSDVLQTGAVDILEFTAPDKKLLMPYLKKYVEEINIDENYIVADLTEAVEE